MQPADQPTAESLLDLVESTVFAGVWVFDVKTDRMTWSRGLAAIHGTALNFAPERPRAFDFYTAEWRVRIEQLVQACAHDGSGFDEEMQIVTAQQRRCWVRSVGRAVRDAEGAIVRVEGAVQEIAPQGYREGTLLRHTVRLGGAPGSGEAFATVDREGRFTYVNEEGLRLLAGDDAELLGKLVWSFFQKTVRLRLEENIRAALHKGTVVEFEEMDARGMHWLHVRGYPVGGGLALHLRDVSASRKSQEQLRLLESSIARLNDIVIITEANPFNAPGPRIVFVNEAFEHRTGYTRDEVIGKSPRILQGPETQRAELDHIRAALEEWEPVRVDLINYTKAGDPYWVDLDVSPVWDKARKLTHWVSVGRDISERKAAEEKIQRLAFFDTLTRLPNRQLLLDRLQAALSGDASLRKGALMFIDLDNFKVLNDTLGHQHGDVLLQQVAQRLRSCVHNEDTVARLGGDEFVVLLQDSTTKPMDPHVAARKVSDRILKALGEPYALPGCMHHSTCSIGVTLFDNEPCTVGELLKQADLAMYQAKNAGRNAVCFFDPNMQALATANATLATDLRQAWREGQFHLEYQPQMGSQGKMTGVEALLRWNHPQHGTVMPASFIPTAEETSLIIPIGHWVLETACAQLASWSKRPDRAHLSIAVNVSVRQFRHPDFVESVMQAITDAGVAPHKLKLELTESLLAEGIEVTVAKMGNLKALGVTLSIDDFGMGYSSLSYLKRLPIDQLKIDREFVKDVLTDANDAAIAQVIVGLSRNLGLDVIAEGVETLEQHAFLAQLGCSAFQGYLFCPPLPIGQLEEFMNTLALQDV